MKCPKCRSTNVSVHRGNPSRVWCRACGGHFYRDLEIEKFMRDLTGLLGRLERVVGMAEKEWKERFDSVVRWFVMEVQGEGYSQDFEALTTAKIGYAEPDLGGNFDLWNDEMSRIQAAALRAAADHVDPDKPKETSDG